MSPFLNMVEAELARARSLHPDSCTNNLHGGYAVILEELDELWDEVRKKPYERSVPNLRDELVQIAAMAARMAEDCGLVDRPAEDLPF